MWPFLVLHMVTHHSVALRCMEIIDKRRVWICLRSHIVCAVNPTSPEAAELTDRAPRNSFTPAECVTQQPPGTYMCLQERWAVQSTSSHFWWGNSSKSLLSPTDRERCKELIHHVSPPSPASRLSELASVTRGKN